MQNREPPARRYEPARRSLPWLCALAVMLSASSALACGVSGPDGVWSCSLEEHDEAERPRWNVGTVGAYTWTKLRFTHGLRAPAERSAALAVASYAPTKFLRIQTSVGALTSGHLSTPDGRHDFSPGVAGAAGLSYRFLTGKPFLVLSGVVSGSTARTHLRGSSSDKSRYSALDLRLGLAFGATFFNALSPYAVARAFGGPIFGTIAATPSGARTPIIFSSAPACRIASLAGSMCSSKVSRSGSAASREARRRCSEHLP